MQATKITEDQLAAARRFLDAVSISGWDERREDRTMEINRGKLVMLLAWYGELRVATKAGNPSLIENPMDWFSLPL